MGYSVNYAYDVYRMLNMETKYVINLQDIIWLNQMYNDWKVKKVKKSFEDNEGIVIEPKVNKINKVQEEVHVEKVLDEQKRAKAYRNLRQLESSFNPDASRIVERIEPGREILLDHANFTFMVEDMLSTKEPVTLMNPGIIMIHGLERND
jgi:hypothetical protein